MSRLGLGFALALATFGCAQEREPINRVQPNALKKSFFVGEDLLGTKDDPEFYYRGTVVDTGFGAQQDGLFTSTYAMPVSRIKWEVTENRLIGRLAYERIDNTDGKVGTQKGMEGQVVVAFPIQTHFDIRRSYNPVTGEEQNVVEENMSDRPWYEREYFRVDWSRNEVTNAYDFDTLSMIGVYGGVMYEPMSYYVNDPTNPDAPVFDDGYFDVTQKVYATPQVIHFSPQMADLFGIDAFPACMLDADIGGGTAPLANCNPHELKLRLSFRKVVDTDYEAQDWDGIRFQAFGAFTVNFSGRTGYTRPYGLVDDKTRRFIERYNIWQKSHYYNQAGQPVVCGTPETEATSMTDGDGNGTIDACEAVTAATGMGGSRCDVYAKKCTLPFRSRAERPIVWYYNDGDIKLPTDPNVPWAADLFEPTDWATQEWDVAIRSARMVAKQVECKRTGGEAGQCEANFPHWKGQMEDTEDAIRLTREVNHCRRANAAATNGASWTNGSCNSVADQKAAEWGISDAGVIAVAKMDNSVMLCHSPVAAGDHPECRKPFKPGQEMRTRLGDLRFNSVNTLNTPQVPSSWGIMVDAKDPLTGENIAASINIWNHVTDSAAQGALDTIRYINGEITTAEITDGKYIQDWVRANEGLAGGSRTTPPMGKEEVVQRLASAAGAVDEKSIKQVREAFEAYTRGDTKAMQAKAGQGIKLAKDLSKDIRATGDTSKSTNAARIKARMAQARGTDFEAQLINQQALEAVGIDPKKVDDSTASLAVDLASPLRMGNDLVVSRIRQARQNAMGERGACLIEATPEFSSIIGLARIMREKFPVGDDGASSKARIDRMRKYIARRLQYGVIIHEMGHSFGERHNFVSSFDALSFRPQYWQLRTKNGAVTQPCANALTLDENGKQVLHDGAHCVGPRYFDPITQEEEDGLLWMWQQSSVMDYPGDIAVDTLGLGAYDMAATRMFYGESTSVFANDGTPGSGINALWVQDADNDGFPDKFEESLGSDPADPASRPSTDPNIYGDGNGNSVPDAIEGLFADVGGADATDTDKDGVPDFYERLLGTDPSDHLEKNPTLREEKFAASRQKARGTINYTTAVPGARHAQDMIDRMDNFGGILGLRTGDAHYTQHQAKYNVLRADQCVDVGDPRKFKPADWNDAIDGDYHPTLDARVVAVDGAYTRCRQQPVDYVNWSDLKPLANTQTNQQTVIGDAPPAVDPQGRIRFPYPFASDNWADTGNVSVYRHDQGADVYEQYMFLMGSQENRHIFDHYRRNRVTFAIRPAKDRDFSRYTAKIMNSVKGLGLYRNIYSQDYIAGIWGLVAGGFLADNVLAASLAMDHFSRQITRPQDGEHFLYEDLFNNTAKPYFRSSEDTFIVGPNLAQDNDTEALKLLQSATNDAERQAALKALKSALNDNPMRITIPNGTAGYLRPDDGTATAFSMVGFGGRPIHNALDRTKGDYSSSYQLSVGSYYEKINAIMALTESQDNFISASRSDFVDARYRAASVADVFPEGFRRLVSAALTNDVFALGPRVATNSAKQVLLPKYEFVKPEVYEAYGVPPEDRPASAASACEDKGDPKKMPDCLLGEDGNPYPRQPMAWTSWWPTTGPKSCWTINGSQLCYSNDDGGHPIDPGFGVSPPGGSLPIDPQIGWEVQKYIIAWTYLYLPENSRTDWFDMLRIYRSYDVPEIKGAVVKWRDPITGTLYVARSYGKETTVGGKQVEIGIAARVLQHANELTALAYSVGGTDPDTGEQIVNVDENGLPISNKLLLSNDANGDGVEDDPEYIDVPDVENLKRYKSIPDFMWQAGEAYGIKAGNPKGIY